MATGAEEELERIRRIWTPRDDIAEIFGDMSPQSELDSMLRHFLHAILEQQLGSVAIDLGSTAHPVFNTGEIEWRMVHGPGPDEHPELRGRQVTIWHKPVN